MTKRYAIKIAYIGKGYQGFQRQTESIKTIEGKIIEVLIKLEIIRSLSESRYSAAGRTDKGVNAISQVIAFDSLREEIHLEELNTYFPDDIYAWAIAEVNSDFNARRNAYQRTYKYYHYYFNENIKLMSKALKKLEGNHDFTKLCKKDKLVDGTKKSTEISLDSAKLRRQRNLIRFEFTSRSFLWNQVRKMVSIVLDVGSGKYSLDIIDDVLNPETPLPKGGIRLVPPEGLVLYDVKYKSINFVEVQKKTPFKARIQKKLNFYSSSSAVMELIKDILLK